MKDKMIQILITDPLSDAGILVLKDANIEDKEEYLKINVPTIQAKMNKILNCKDKANNIPK